MLFKDQKSSHHSTSVNSGSFNATLSNSVWVALGYELLDTRTSEIGEITLFRHSKSGATVITINDQQPLHSFMVSVPTRISNDSGIAHVKEHMVLFRSRKAKGAADSFSDMRFSSYKTDISAATDPDCTVYPVASPLKTEMYRLARAYVSRLLAPKYTEDDFQLEAWHVGLLKNGENQIPQFGGVVYSEVRDYFSDPDWHAIHELDKHLFPETHYRFDHGGLPLEVLKLTTEDLQKYWAENYLTSRMLFLVRQPGDLPEALRMLSKELGSHSSDAKVIPATPQAPFLKLREAHSFYPFFGESLEEAPRRVELAWAFSPTVSLKRNARLELLANILAGHDGSPLMRELSIRFPKATVTSRFDTGTLQPHFCLDIEGIGAPDAHEVRRVVFEELRKICIEGINPLLIKIVRHQLAIERYDRLHDPEEGTELMFKLASLHSHGVPPLEFFDHQYEVNFATEADLQTMIRQDLLENPHAVLLTVEPDLELAARYYREEAQALTQAMSTNQDLAQGAERRERWMQKMMSDEHSEWRARDLDDIVTPRILPVELRNRSDIAPGLFQSTISSHEIVGFNFFFDAGEIPSSLLPFTPLFSEMVLSRFSPYLRREERQLQFAAALPEAEVRMGFYEIEGGLKSYLVVSGRTVTAEFANALEHLKALLLEPLEVGPRLAESQIEQSYNAAKSLWLSSPWDIVRSQVKAGVGLAYGATDLTEGFQQLQFLRDLRKQTDSESLVSDAILRIQKQVITQFPSYSNVVCHVNRFDSATAELRDTFGFPSGIPFRTSSFKWTPNQSLQSWRHPSLSSTAVQAFNLSSLSLTERAHARVLFALFHHRELHPVLRTAHGAYRVLCSFDSDSSTGILEVSRSPKETAKEALRIFDKVFEYGLKDSITKELVDSAKRGVVGDLDAEVIREPIALSQTLLRNQFWGWCVADRLALRKAVLEVNVDDIRALSEKLTQKPPLIAKGIALSRRVKQ